LDARKKEREEEEKEEGKERFLKLKTKFKNNNIVSIAKVLLIVEYQIKIPFKKDRR